MNAFSAAPQPPSYAILRVEKIKTVAELERRSAHNDRSNLSENVNPDGPQPVSLISAGQGTLSERTGQVLSQFNIDLAASEGKIIACEMVITASKAFFESCDQAQFEDWIRSSCSFAEDKFGRGIVDVVLHMDEEVPHIHAIGVPVAERRKLKRGAPPRDPEAKLKWDAEKLVAPLVWTLSFDAVFGGSRDTLSELQDDYHSAVRHLGLARGERNRSSKTVDLGDGIEIDAAPFGRGLKPDGSERPRRNIRPQEYRQMIKREREAAAREAQQERLARQESEQLLARAEREAEKASEDKLAAETALDEALAERLKAQDIARQERELADIVHAEAEQLLIEARAEKKAALEKAALIKAELIRERDQLDEERREDQIRLGLLEKAVDDKNGLNLRPQGEAFAMDQGRMSEPERAAYSKIWPRALFEIGRKLAAVMAKFRALLKIVGEEENRAIERKSDAAQKDPALNERKARLAGWEQVLKDREASIDKRDQAADHRQRELDDLKAAIAFGEDAVETTRLENECRSRELVEGNISIAARDAASREWAEIIRSVMSGEYYVRFEDPTRPKQLVPDDERATIPAALKARFATKPPAWAAAALVAYEALARQAHMVGVIEDKVTAHEKRLRELVVNAGPVLTKEQSTRVDDIKEALAPRPSAAEIAARGRDNGPSF